MVTHDGLIKIFNMNRDKYTKFYLAFDIEETDPRSDLSGYIDEKEQDLIRYSRRRDASKQYIQRRFKEISYLQQIHDKLTNLNLYMTWVKLEQIISAIRDRDFDGIRITIPFVQNVNDGRLFDIDYRRGL